MPEPQYQDAITYEQPLRREITEKQNQIFEDKNLFLVLDFLRANNQPMTVEDLEENFKKISEKKSNKSIYRYLKRLEDEKLVIQAGKRVYPFKNKLKTQTLYMRTAKIFYPVAKPKNQCSGTVKEQKDKMIEAIGQILGKQLKGSLKSNKCLKDFINKIYDQQSELAIKFIDEADEEIAEKIRPLDWSHTQVFLESIGLLALFSDDNNWYKELKSCFEERNI